MPVEFYYERMEQAFDKEEPCSQYPIKPQRYAYRIFDKSNNTEPLAMVTSRLAAEFIVKALNLVAKLSGVPKF